MRMSWVWAGGRCAEIYGLVAAALECVGGGWSGTREATDVGTRWRWDQGPGRAPSLKQNLGHAGAWRGATYLGRKFLSFSLQNCPAVEGAILAPNTPDHRTSVLRGRVSPEVVGQKFPVWLTLCTN